MAVVVAVYGFARCSSELGWWVLIDRWCRESDAGPPCSGFATELFAADVLCSLGSEPVGYVVAIGH